MVSHDRGFIDEVVDHVLAIEKVNWNFIKGISIYEEQKNFVMNLKWLKMKIEKKSVG